MRGCDCPFVAFICFRFLLLLVVDHGWLCVCVFACFVCCFICGCLSLIVLLFVNYVCLCC